jgi:hypothetical protein
MPKRQNRSVQTLFAQPATPAMKPMAHAKNLSASQSKSGKTASVLTVAIQSKSGKTASVLTVAIQSKSGKTASVLTVASQTPFSKVESA